MEAVFRQAEPDRKYVPFQTIQCRFPGCSSACAGPPARLQGPLKEREPGSHVNTQHPQFPMATPDPTELHDKMTQNRILFHTDLLAVYKRSL